MAKRELTAEMLEKVEKYLENVESDFVKTKETCDSENKLISYQKVPKIPNHERIAAILKISRGHLLGFREHQESDTPEMTAMRERLTEQLSRCTTIQGAMLQELGVSGVWNALVVNRILAVVHGFKEKIDLTSDGKPVNDYKALPLSQKAQKAVDDFNLAMKEQLIGH